MKRDELADLLAFVAVAEECNFTRAAARLGISQSALSHTVRRLEERLGVTLLDRTTRSVTPTEAGSRMARSLRPSFDDILASVSALDELRDKPAGTVRITTSSHAAETVLWPAISRLLVDNPELNVEISVDQKLVDIGTGRFDVGVRLGEQVSEGMEAVQIGPDLRMAVVGSPAYFARHPAPKTPHDLLGHMCINLRLPTLGDLYPWEFEGAGRELEVRVDGRFIADDMLMIVKAAVDGIGLACVMEDQAMSHLRSGRLVRVLDDWCPPFPGYHLYHSRKKRQTAALSLVIKALRYPREDSALPAGFCP